jgi:prevent-host-death family protein
MTKTVSAAEAKNRFGAILEQVREGNEVIIARHGKPEAAFIPVADYYELQEMRKARDRAEALQRLDELEKEISARNQDLSEEESIAMAVRLARELFQDYIDRERRESGRARRRSA